MKRYFEEVRLWDRIGLEPDEIAASMGFNPQDWADVWAAARIYVEDGGKRYTFDEFVAACKVEAPFPEAAQEFLAWKGFDGGE